MNELNGEIAASNPDDDQVDQIFAGGSFPTSWSYFISEDFDILLNLVHVV